MHKAYIQHIEYYLPEAILSNEHIAQSHPEWSVDKIASKTGIFERHIAAEDEFSSDMAIKAANKLFEAGVDKDSIDYILLCTQSPDYFLPTTACIIQEKLGLRKNIGALDFNLGCSGFIYGIGLAKGLIVSGQAKNVLLLTSETYSKFIHQKDKSNKTLFGDAAAATLVSSNESPAVAGEIGDFSYFTDGAGYDNLIVTYGGMRHKNKEGADEFEGESFVRNNENLYMNGSAIFNFTAFNIPPLVTSILEKNKLALDDIDLFVFHQANEYMLDVVRKRCNIPKEKFYIYLKNCGNTVSSTIPIALSEAAKSHSIKKGSKVLLCGFGVGLSAGGVIVQYC
jgi:3-oxoacyl-[acyl-carrier-protein] synthase III